MIRIGIRRQLLDRINIIKSTSLEAAYERKMSYVSLLRTRPIAIETATANEQHYEVGTGVLGACLGPRMKYSCALYPKGGETLAQAEIAMLESYGKYFKKIPKDRILWSNAKMSRTIRGHLILP